MMGGQVAEKMIFNEMSTGPSSDLQRATQLAKQIVTQFGMSEKLGSRTYGQREEMIFLGKEIHERRDYSEKTAQLIDEEVSKLVQNGYDKAEKILKKFNKYLDKIAQTLIKKETLERKEFEALFKGLKSKSI